jgi:hypothetical protein
MERGVAISKLNYTESMREFIKILSILTVGNEGVLEMAYLKVQTNQLSGY